MAYMKLDGTLMLQWRPPATGGLATPGIVLTYNLGSAGSGTNVYGRSWYGSWDRQVQASLAGATVTTGGGAVLPYESPVTGSYYTPPDGAGNSLQAISGGWVETQPNGFQIQYQDNGSGLGLVLQMKNPSSAAWTVTRDASNRVVAINDVGGVLGQTTSLIYGTFGISRITDPAGRDTLLQVNSAGNLVQITDPELCITSIGYDSSNLLIAWVTPAGVATSFLYNGSQQLDAVSTPSGSYSISYSPGVVNITNPRGFTNRYALDGGGQLQSLTNPLGAVTTYGWQNNLPATITDPLGNTYSLGYAQMASDGGTWRLQSVQLPTGARYSYAFASDMVQSVADPLGNVTSLTWSGYNLSAVQDALGNRSTFGYMPYGQLQSVTNALGDTNTLVYSTSDEGVQIADVNPLGNRTTYTSNAAGMKVQVQDALGQITSCVRDDDNHVLVCTDALGNSTTSTYSSGLLQSVTNALGNRTTLNYSYYHFDGVGSTQLLTDENANVTDIYCNTAFGLPVDTGAANPTTNPFRFVGQLGYYFNQGTGNYYVRARTYSPTLATWLSRDPAESDPNFYRYCGHRPLTQMDPSGLWELRCRRMGVVGYAFKHCWIECGGHSYSLLNKDGTATPVIDDPADLDKGSIEVESPCSCCACIAAQFGANMATYPYDKDDCNSNYRANSLLRSCGIVEDRPTAAYGWDASNCTRPVGRFSPKSSPKDCAEGETIADSTAASRPPKTFGLPIPTQTTQ
jgi:RHS repeat-associated protein